MNMIRKLVAVSLAAGVFGAFGEDEKSTDFDPIVCLFLNTTTVLPGDALALDTMRTLRRDYNLRRFMFDPPGLRHPLGNADLALHAKIGESMAAARRALAGTDIEVVWFVRPVLCWNERHPNQHVMDCEGNVASAWCPYDRTAADGFLAKFAKVAALGRPSAYVIEDDFNLSGHSGLANRHGGCFCPLHLAELARRTGRPVTAAELGAAYDAPTAANEALRRTFAEVSRDSLRQLAVRLRETLDKTDPSARIGLCQSAQVDIDGDTTEGNARALAGATRPFVRVYGAAYFSQNVPEDLPTVTAHAFYSAQHLPKDVEKIFEADSFPHTRFYNSTRFYVSEMAAALMAGMEDMLLFCVPSFENPLEDPAYLDAFRANRRRFLAVRDFRRRSELTGVRAVYDPEVMYMCRRRGTGMLSEEARVLAKFGFPMTTLPSKASVLFGDTPKHLSEDKLREIFRGAVIVDSTAALAMESRGLGSWLGCGVKLGEDTLEFARSRVLSVPGLRRTGLNPYDYHILGPVTPVPGWDMEMNYAHIRPGEKTETWIRYEMPDGRDVGPSFVASPNALGGHVAVMSFAVKGNFREWLYNAGLQDCWRLFFERYAGGAADVVATRTPGTWLSAAVSGDGRELLVMVNNLAGEPRDDISLEFAAKWRGGKVERLTSDGTWVPAGAASDAFRPADGFTYEAMVPEFFKVTRK